MNDPARSEPRKLVLRRADVLAWTGISEYELKALMAAGIIKGARLTPGGRLYFYREHIRAAILGPLSSKEENP